ncbi:hypothetical protein LCGC14_2196600 [marine sediment metagenome]|uniref:Uncharacterized protein n=1 Tax=marine sediment metagenome TaxID=412755 RepID=A0A0F9FVE7_9ZZZZ
MIRSDIKGKVTKRKNSMVFNPSESKSKGAERGGKPRTKNQLETNVARLIAKAKKA